MMPRVFVYEKPVHLLAKDCSLLNLNQILDHQLDDWDLKQSILKKNGESFLQASMHAFVSIIFFLLFHLKLQ